MPPPLSDVELLGRLVALDTTSSESNLALVDLLADHLEGPGVELVRQPSPDGVKANLVVRVGPEGAGDGRGLVLSGHMDTVPAGDDGWSSDPFRLTRRDGLLVARGTADMKGFLAVAANVARRAASARLAAPLVLLLTYDEEVGSLGAARLAAGWEELAAGIGPLPRAAVIGEPTELAAVRLHKGHLKLRIELTGRSAHSGYPHLGVNAIEAAGRAVAALSELRRRWEAEEPGAADFPEVPFVALNVGTVRGGTAINVVPARCTVEVGVRTLPGRPAGALTAEVRRVVEEAVAGGPPAGVEVRVLSDSPPLATPDDAPLHRHLLAALGQEGTRSVHYSTDAGCLQELGLDCVVFGPGSIEVAHRPDEAVPEADLRAARGHLEGLVASFCGAA